MTALISASGSCGAGAGAAAAGGGAYGLAAVGGVLFAGGTPM